MIDKLPLAPAISYAPVNRCIYCGAEDGSLSKEHIVPRGLNGNLILPAASCIPCARITSEFERQVLRGFFEKGRLALGISSRHKNRQRPTSSAVTLINDATSWEAELPIIGNLQVIHFPVFIRPLCLGGVSRDANAESLEVMAIDTLHIGSAATLRDHGATGVEMKDSLQWIAFARMLAKIAHSYFVAEKGWFPLSQSPVLPFLLGHSRGAKEWLGCLEDAPLEKAGSKALHLLDITELSGEDGSQCWVVRIKLLSVTSGPTYAVVVRVAAR